MSKISFSTMATPNQNVVDSVKMANSFGFDGIDLRMSDYKGEIAEYPNNRDLKNLYKLLNSEGIKLASIFTYNKKGNDKDPASWTAMEEDLYRLTDVALELGSPALIIMAGDPQLAKSPEAFILKTADILNKVFAKDSSSVEIRLQNHKGSFNFMQGRHLAMILNNKRFSQAFSPDHCYLMNENLEEIFTLAKETTSQIYISDLVIDNTKEGCTRTAIGEGDVPLARALNCLGNNFNGYVTLKWEKIWNDYLVEAPEAFFQFKKWLKKNFTDEFFSDAL